MLEAQAGLPYARAREKEAMQVLAFLGRHGHQDADGLSRSRPVSWLVALADEVSDLLLLEAEAMRSARARGGG